MTNGDVDQSGSDGGAHFGAGDLLVSTEVDLPGDRSGPLFDQLPAREVLYRLVRERGPISVADLAREFETVAPSGARPPYAQDPEAYVVRLVAGGRAALAPLADLPTLLAAVAALSGPD